MAVASVEGVTSIDGDNEEVCAAGITICYHPCVVYDRFEACLDSVGLLEGVEVSSCIFYRSRDKCLHHNAAEYLAYSCRSVLTRAGLRGKRVASVKRGTVRGGRLPEARSRTKLAREDRPVTPAWGIMGW